MASKKLKAVALAMLVVAGTVQLAEAQAPLGVRASGMAGAFVGVAEDASAVYWNPAGLATGAFASLVIDFGEAETATDTPAGGERWTGRMAALSLPQVGIGYYRQGVYAAGPQEPAVAGVPGREEVRRSVHAITTSTFGATLLQSLGEFVVVGTTLKLVRGSAAAATTRSIDAGDALDEAGELPTRSETAGDLDAGVMVSVQRVRLGLVARNLTTPAFKFDSSDSGEVELEREARIGAAWGSGWPGASRVIVAVDADVIKRTVRRGERRDLAAGVETWWKGQRVGVRAGLRRSMIGDSRAVVAAGVSAGLTPSIFLEGHLARGQQDERSWSVGARFGF